MTKHNPSKPWMELIYYITELEFEMLDTNLFEENKAGIIFPVVFD